MGWRCRLVRCLKATVCTVFGEEPWSGARPPGSVYVPTVFVEVFESVLPSIPETECLAHIFEVGVRSSQGLRWSNSALLASADGSLCLWDFRCAEATWLWGAEGAALTAAAVGSDGCHATVTILTAEGLAIQGLDLRRPEAWHKPLLLRDLLQLYPQQGSINVQDIWASCLSVGVLGETCAVLSDGTSGVDYMVSCVGGPSTSPVSMHPSSFNITALQCASNQGASLVGVCAPSKGWAELRWLSKTSSSITATRKATKPKKFFRQRDAGENDFRDRGTGRRARR